MEVGRGFPMSNSTVDTPRSDQGLVIVRGSATGFVQEIVAGNHHLTADEPVGSGGTDRGPTPYDLVLAALGA
jgi:putative redox protein